MTVDVCGKVDEMREGEREKEAHGEGEKASTSGVQGREEEVSISLRLCSTREELSVDRANLLLSHDSRRKVLC